MSWIVGKTSPWGTKHPCGIVGGTQMAFLSYTQHMGTQSLYQTARGGALHINGTFKTPKAVKRFKEELYGLGKGNEIESYVEQVLSGEREYEQPFAIEKYRKYLHPTPKKKRAKTAGPKTTGESGGETEPTTQTRSSLRVTPAPNYEESSEQDAASDDETEIPQPAHKKPKTCENCAILTKVREYLHQVDTTDPQEDIVATLQGFMETPDA